MKFTKQARMLLLVVLASASILPGCGKSKNSPSGVVVGGPGGGAVVVPGGTAGAFSAGGTLTVSNASGWVYGAIDNMSGGVVAGNTYQKTNASGDQILLTLAGTPMVGGVGYSSLAAYATVYLSQTTVSYFSAYCGSAPVRVTFSGTALIAGTPGTIGSLSPRIEAANGCGILL